jgi:hypothetical protein
MQDSLGKAIIVGAANPESKDLVVSLSEVCLHSFMGDGVLKEVPVLKSVLAFHKTWATIRDRFFLRKVEGFMQGCPKFTEAEWESFRSKHLDGQNGKKLADAIVLILDRLDDLEKPEVLAKVFAALVRGKIDFESFRRLAAAIDIGFLADLTALCEKPDLHAHAGLAQNLLRTGLVELDEQMDRMAIAQIPGRLGLAYRLNGLGKTFINCVAEADTPA